MRIRVDQRAKEVIDILMDTVSLPGLWMSFTGAYVGNQTGLPTLPAWPSYVGCAQLNGALTSSLVALPGLCHEWGRYAAWQQEVAQRHMEREQLRARLTKVLTAVQQEEAAAGLEGSLVRRPRVSP